MFIGRGAKCFTKDWRKPIDRFTLEPRRSRSARPRTGATLRPTPAISAEPCREACRHTMRPRSPVYPGVYRKNCDWTKMKDWCGSALTIRFRPRLSNSSVEQRRRVESDSRPDFARAPRLGHCVVVHCATTSVAATAVSRGRGSSKSRLSLEGCEGTR